jgi:flagellar biosynthesis/type III secretory pathway chaperone
MEHEVMNELQNRINSVIQILASDLPKTDKVVAASQAFSGMDITHLSKQKTQSVYQYIMTSNKIMARYPTIKSHDDYKIMSHTDLNKLLKNVQQLCLKLSD